MHHTTIRHVHHADRCAATAHDALSIAANQLADNGPERALKDLIDQAMNHLTIARNNLCIATVTLDTTRDHQ